MGSPYQALTNEAAVKVTVDRLTIERKDASTTG